MKKLIVVMMAFALGLGATPHSFAAQAKLTDQLSDSKLTFAYADATGTRLLGFDQKHPKQYTQAISAPGRGIPIQYVKHQKQSDESNGRNNMYNFNKDEGEIYKVVKGKLPENESVVLAAKDAFQGHTFLAYRPVSIKGLDKKTVKAIEKAKKRKVLKHWKIGEVPSEVQVGIIEFERVKGKKPLASFVLVTKNGILFDDYEGNEGDNSVWRVDDGGEMDPSFFRVIFLTRSASGYSVGFEWYGYESNGLSVLQQNGKSLRQVEHSSRYIAPL
ncbi:hypothetical protein [Paenibacillus terrigena]|uniref:hypothetical protein n=1 Tax=Paenibacillus terrigena TaxID=369333 RepID=UPI000368F136|nr:hypothetical protein [Paenibacillus terrigena]